MQVQKQTWKISINSQIDDKLRQFFPNDPYGDLTINSETQQLQLTLAYLSIDSNFFAQHDPSILQIDLSHLPEEALLMVLRSLYGGELEVSSVSLLDDVLSVINYLQIKEYRQNMVNELLSLPCSDPETSPLYSIQMFQFCLKNNIIVSFISQLHINSDLVVLENSKNYLQLSKLSSNYLNKLLLTYLERKGAQGHRTINNILQNYLTRNNLRPTEYLMGNELLPLWEIWEEYHHIMHFVTPPKVLTNSNVSSPRNTITSLFSVNTIQEVEEKDQYKFSMDKMNTLPSLQDRATRSQSLSNSKSSSEEEVLDMKIQMLESNNYEQNEKIRSLNGELRELLDQLDVKNVKDQSDRKQKADLNDKLMVQISQKVYPIQKPLKQTRQNSLFQSCKTPTF